MYLHYLRCYASFYLSLALLSVSLFHLSSLPFIRCSHRQYIDAGVTYVTYQHHCFPTMNTHMSISFLCAKHDDRVWGSSNRNGKTNTHHQYMCKQRLDSVLPSHCLSLTSMLNHIVNVYEFLPCCTVLYIGYAEILSSVTWQEKSNNFELYFWNFGVVFIVFCCCCCCCCCSFCSNYNVLFKNKY